MTGQDFHLLEKIFHRALEVPDGAERDRFVESSCPPDLRENLRLLLTCDAAAASEPAAPSGSLPRFGPYQVDRTLGSGGSGLVYLAHRSDGQFEQEVAIKVLRATARTEYHRRRFVFERQVLAQLKHPNIAALFDGGVTAGGEPYLVMEYVAGEHLNAYCDRRRLSLAQRLAIFMQVLDAVEHAHHNLIIHGDLKPSNILTTPQGRIKVVDFGTSRFLDEPGTVSIVAVTPMYASPEQLRAERLTVAVDVFSLGVVLYELLTGNLPFQERGSLFSALERAAREENPRDPAASLTDDAAALRRTSTVELRHAIRGDLSSILRKALAPEPSRRYASVADFAADLERYRRREPIRARPQTWTYRASRFARRNRISVAAAAAVTVAIVGGAWVSLFQARVAAGQRRIAEARLATLQKLTGAILFEFHDAIQSLPGSTPARKLLVQRALEYLNSLDPATTREPAQRAQIVEAYRKIGDVQGNPTNANLGDTAGAMASYRKALALAEPMVAANPNDLDARRVLARLLERMADTQAATGDVQGAVERSTRSLAMFQEITRRDPSPEARQHLGTAHIKLADLLGHPSFPNLGDRAGALEHYRQAEAIYAAQPSNDVTRRYLGIVNERIGRMLELDGRTNEALACYTQSFQIREAFAADHPTDANARRDLAIAHEKLGDMLLESGRPRPALERFRKALAIFESLHALDPLNANARRAVAIECEKLAAAEDRAGHQTKAAQFYGRALTIYREMNASDPSNVGIRSDLQRLATRTGSSR